jgi:hypothetical protein
MDKKIFNFSNEKFYIFSFNFLKIIDDSIKKENEIKLNTIYDNNEIKICLIFNSLKEKEEVLINILNRIEQQKISLINKGKNILIY